MLQDTTDTPTMSPRIGNPLRPVAAVQGAYFLLTGVWPLFDIDSFQAVTGPKTDLWLVYTVGALVAAIGVSLLVAAGSGRTTREVLVLATGSALALAAIDVAFVLRGVISWPYLMDAAVEVALVGWWMLALARAERRRQDVAAPRYPHVQALLARGQSVSPNGRA